MNKEQTAKLEEILIASIEFVQVITPLHEDLQYHAQMLNTDGGQFWRRGFVRALFAFIEGATYRMKQIAHAYRFQPGVSFSLAEQTLLLEEAYELDDKGNINTKSARIQLYKNIKFAFRAFAKAHLAEYELKTDGEGWYAFKKSIKIRDRLTHPKQAEELTISDTEARSLSSAYTWFENSINEVQDVSYLALEESLKQESQ